MATAAMLGGGMIVGGLLAGQGAKEQAKANVEAANIQAQSAANALAASQQQQAIENARSQALSEPSLQAQQTQLALLGQGGPEAAQQAAQGLMSSPLVNAINQMNQQNINAQAAASGVSGGNLLSALQQANTATIMQSGFGGLGQVAGQQQQGALGFGGLASGALGMANQQQNIMGAAQGQAASAQGTVNAVPWLTGAGMVNNLTNLAGFGMSGGFNNMQAPNFSLPSFGGGTPAAATSNVVQNPVRAGNSNYLF